jgi:hypothetical protein
MCKKNRTLYEVRTKYTIMGLVWASIPLVLIGIIGFEESFGYVGET